ncbi:MAG: ABC transporter ATP-binding protein [candidate division NC10 bacterium]|nr:ABC transporter ATP-binding protein [candidate division NC10 bacterium]
MRTQPEAEPILACHDVSGGYALDAEPLREVLKGISFQVRAGDCYSITGPSGSGKSALLRLLNRFEDPIQGEIRFRGAPVQSYDPLELRRRIALVLQQPVMFHGTVRENLLRRPGGEQLSETALGQALEEVGLDRAFLVRNAMEVSGGEKQRISIARSLLGQPDIILLDEPTSALDARSLHLVADLIGQLNRVRGLTVIIVTHQPEMIHRLGGRVLFLDKGHIIRETDAEEAARILEEAQ